MRSSWTSILVYSLAIIGICLYGSSCANEQPEADLQLPDTVSFQTDILPLLRVNCAISSCHTGSHAQRNLNLEDSEAYTQLWKQGLLDTLTAEQSALYIQMSSSSDPMPPTGKLDSRSLGLVLKWIQQGAQNN